MIKKKIHYVAGQSSYEIELRPGFNKWWLLLLLLPLLLLIRLEKTVYVKAVYDNQVAVPGVSVAFQYKRYIPFSDGALLSDSLIVLKGITDSSGVVKLEGLRYSVFSYIFKWGTDAMVSGESDCFSSDTLLTRFHGLSDGGELVLPMNPSRMTLDFRVVDKEDGEPLPDSRVLLRSSLLGKVYIDSARSDTAGMVRFSGVPKCGKVELAHGSQEGYYSDSIVDREVPMLLAGGLDSNRTLRLKPIRVPITFFITDCQTGKGLSGATGEISFTYPNGKPGKKKRVLTNIHGVGKGTYDSAWLLSTIEIIGSRPGYKDGRLDGVHPVRDFIQYPKEKRTFCLEPLPPPPPPPPPPAPPRDSAPLAPRPNCRVHFSGLVMGGEYEENNISKIYQTDAFSEYVGEGEYPDNKVAFPKSVAYTFDGIAIDAGTRLILYSEKDFKGKVLLDVKGPMIVNNGRFQNNPRYSYCNTDVYPPPLQSNYPQSVRIWSSEDMWPWSNGSCKIICAK